MLIFIGFFAFFNMNSFSQTSKPVVTDIGTTPVTRTKINLYWNLPTSTKGSHIASLLVYRDTRPIQDIERLKKLEPIATLPQGTVSYNDSVKDQREYYYAVITVTEEGDWTGDELYYDEELDPPPVKGNGTPFYIILPGVNSTTYGTKGKVLDPKKTPNPYEKQVEKEKENPGSSSIRQKPLPYINILDNQTNARGKLSKEAQMAGESLVKKYYAKEPAVQKDVYVFQEDLMSPDGGDEYQLFEILKGSFIQKKYRQAIKDLNRFLSHNRNSEVTIRAKFYLGESYYYVQDYAMALNCFLETQEKYPSLSKEWIEASLDSFEADFSE